MRGYTIRVHTTITPLRVFLLEINLSCKLFQKPLDSNSIIGWFYSTLVGLTFGANVLLKSTIIFFDIGPYFKRTVFFAIQSSLIAHMHNVYLAHTHRCSQRTLSLVTWMARPDKPLRKWCECFTRPADSFTTCVICYKISPDDPTNQRFS